MSSDDDLQASEGDLNDFVRPFLVTAGRTQSAVEGLEFETLIQSNTQSADDLRFEPARVFELCQDATAIAEVAARLDMPIGTVKVVIGDLVESGHLSVHETIDATDSEDIQLISRLIAGVRKL